MCGLVGVVTSHDVGVCLYDTLTVLQHRGQDAAGIMTSDHGKLNLRKDNGLVKDCLLYTSPSPRDQSGSRMPSSA